MASLCPHQNIGADDSLIDMARRNPIGTAGFLKSAMCLCSVTGAVVCTANAVALWFYWPDSSACERPLGWWLIIQTLLQGCLVFLRLGFLAELHVVVEPSTNMETCVSELTSKLAWRASRVITYMTYGWMTLGAVWLINSTGCSVGCPQVYVMTMIGVAQPTIRVALVYRCFVAHCARSQVEEEPQAVVGASKDQIMALPRMRFSAKHSADSSNDCCAVCLCDYKEGDLLRKLPCEHRFHQCCADEWLRRNKRCPLCIRAIDDVTVQAGKLEHLLRMRAH